MYIIIVINIKDFISAASILRLCKAVTVQFSDPYKNVGKTFVFYIFGIVSVLTFLKIVLLILTTNCKNLAKIYIHCIKIVICNRPNYKKEAQLILIIIFIITMGQLLALFYVVKIFIYIK